MNYWYLSLTHYYPKGKTRQVELKAHYSIIECFNEADPKEIDNYKLIYLGFGLYRSTHIQENLNNFVRRIKYAKK